MALVNCVECGKQISSNAVSCPACGCPLSAEQKQTSIPSPDLSPRKQRNDTTSNPKNNSKKIVSVIIGVVVMFLLISICSRNSERDSGEMDDWDVPTQRQSLSNAETHVARGDTHLDRDEFDAAIAEYSKAIQINPNDSYVYFGRGIAYHGKGDFDRAIADFEEMLRINPNDALAKKFISDVRQMSPQWLQQQRQQTQTPQPLTQTSQPQSQTSQPQSQTGTISIQIQSPKPGCMINDFLIMIGMQSYTITANPSIIHGVPIGQQIYSIAGNLQCSDGSWCRGNGSGYIDVQRSPQIRFDWQPHPSGQYGACLLIRH